MDILKQRIALAGRIGRYASSHPTGRAWNSGHLEGWPHQTDWQKQEIAF